MASAVGCPLVVGEVLFDRFEDGAEVLGGAPFNVAWHLQAFGVAPLFVSRVGDDDAGRRVLARMQAWAMRVDGVQIDRELPTGAVRVTLVDGEPAYEIASPAAWDAIMAGGLPEVSPSLVYHGSLAARTPVSRAAIEAIRRRFDVPVFIDVNLRDPWWSDERVRHRVCGAHCVKLNRAELDVLFPGTEPAEVRASQVCVQCDIDTIVVTMGGDGAWAATAAGIVARVAPRPDTRVVDTVGAGDAFASVLLLGFLHGWPLALTLDRAQRFASEVVGVRGATALRADAYEALARAWNLDRD